MTKLGLNRDSLAPILFSCTIKATSPPLSVCQPNHLYILAKKTKANIYFVLEAVPPSAAADC